MEVIKDYPPNYAEIAKLFDIKGKDIVYAYGDYLYNPRGNEISVHLMVHEKTHQRQQGTDPASWWDRYLKDKDFRLSQEIEAYGHQYKYIKDNHTAKSAKWFLNEISKQLSGSMYGNLLDRHSAESKIRHYAKNLV